MTVQKAPGRSSFVMFFVLALALFGGAALGTLLSNLLAPGAMFVRIIAFLAFPLCLGIGLTLWFWTALSILGTHFVGVWLKKPNTEGFAHAREAAQRDATSAPPGSFVFVPVSVIISLCAGIIIALSPTAKGFVIAVSSFTGAGLVYGTLLWLLARSGFLPLPEPS
jgi:hypothetical protein